MTTITIYWIKKRLGDNNREHLFFCTRLQNNTRMKSFCFVLLALLVYWGWFIYTTFEFGKEVAPLKQNCVPLRGPLGAEDVMKWKNVVLTTSVDSLALWNWPGKQDPSVSEYAPSFSALISQSYCCPTRCHLRH